MENKLSSPIQKISTLTEDAIRRRNEGAFGWWGPSPEEARKTMVRKPKGLRDKRTTIKDAVQRYIKDGANIAIGGFVNTRPPVAIVHEIIRKGVKDLTLSFQSNSICPELLAGPCCCTRNTYPFGVWSWPGGGMKSSALRRFFATCAPTA